MTRASGVQTPTIFAGQTGILTGRNFLMRLTISGLKNISLLELDRPSTSRGESRDDSCAVRPNPRAFGRERRRLGGNGPSIRPLVQNGGGPTRFAARLAARRGKAWLQGRSRPPRISMMRCQIIDRNPSSTTTARHRSGTNWISLGWRHRSTSDWARAELGMSSGIAQVRNLRAQRSSLTEHLARWIVNSSGFVVNRSSRNVGVCEPLSCIRPYGGFIVVP